MIRDYQQIVDTLKEYVGAMEYYLSRLNNGLNNLEISEQCRLSINSLMEDPRLNGFEGLRKKGISALRDIEERAINSHSNLIRYQKYLN